MHAGKGRILEVSLEEGYHYARLSCPGNMIPGPGQYLLAASSPEDILPVPVFYTDFAPEGFTGPAPAAWRPGAGLDLRGPLGRGFALPGSARRIALIAFDGTPAHLRGLVRPALQQGASVVLLGAPGTDQLPDEVEVQPLSALGEILPWADFLALDVERGRLAELKERLADRVPLKALPPAQILVRAPMPCGGLAECGVCALPVRPDWKLVCREGPVFDLREV